MSYPIKKIIEIIGGEVLQLYEDEHLIEHLLYDSRKLHFPDASLFFALTGSRRDGHQYISELYKRGVKNFIVSKKIDVTEFSQSNIIFTMDTLAALQLLAAFHRREISANKNETGKVDVISITGSNGKTIVKEWLYQLLQNDYNIVRNPKSYNSQVGVPFSVWQMNSHHNLGIFEAGISLPGEMEKLEAIIRPTIGVLTNIGEAHNEGFKNTEQKFSEKIKLFKNCNVFIARGKDIGAYHITPGSKNGNQTMLTWGTAADDDILVSSIVKGKLNTHINLLYKSVEIAFEIPFADEASIENAITCCCVMLYLGIDPEVICERMKYLQPVNMRLELIKGINHCSIINDSYSTDLSSLHIALNFLQHQSSGKKRTVIISDFLQSGMKDKDLYSSIAASLMEYKVGRIIGIGEKTGLWLKEMLATSFVEQLYFPSTEEFLSQFRFSQLKEEVILVKGARVFQFEKIVPMLEQKVHQTVLEINLNALVHNLKSYHSMLQPSTKVMAMVKAFAYGSGGAEIAGALQYHQADYLGVAYADEGVELRNAGITIPVMVMNPDETSFETLVEYNLEPEFYSFEMLEAFDSFIKKEGLNQYPIHIELETGMNRLGFAVGEIDKLAAYIKSTNSFRVQSVFSHLAASDNSSQDDFTLAQGQSFINACGQFESELGYGFIRHISNTAAIIRHPDLQLDMVRLGIGLYGIDSAASGKVDLQTVAELKSTISQVKKIKANETVSYGRRGTTHKDAVIATVRIGYADGFPRRLGNGKGYMLVKGKPAQVIGDVCMDMTMIDITNIPGVEEGEDVIIFGNELPIQQIAQWAETIPYEIMTGISQRVKRVYFEE